MYRIHQDKSTGTKRSGKFYARAVPVGVMTHDEFCKEVQRNCTVKSADIESCVNEVVQVMTQQMQDSKAVKLDGLGTFRIGLESKGAVSYDKFSAKENITGAHVTFTPERKNHQKPLLDGVTVKELPHYAPPQEP
jgi:predicted histone-like DNA-binding protein